MNRQRESVRVVMQQLLLKYPLSPPIVAPRAYWLTATEEWKFPSVFWLFWLLGQAITELAAQKHRVNLRMELKDTHIYIYINI